MKRVLSVIALLALLPLAAFAEKSKTEGWDALGIMRNARYVYVTSYDGPQFSMNLLPGDRTAIAAVQNAIQNDGYIVVYSPRQADMILVVQARGNSDLLAAYEGGRFGIQTYLWRAEAKNGFSGSNPILMQRLERALKRAGASS